MKVIGLLGKYFLIDTDRKTLILLVVELKISLILIRILKKDKGWPVLRHQLLSICNITQACGIAKG